MATVGLKDLFYAKYNRSETGDEYFDKPMRLAKAIEVKIKINYSMSAVEKEDVVVDADREFRDGTIEINVNDIAPVDKANLLGRMHLVGEDLTISKSSDRAPYVALGFRAKKSGPGNQYRWVWLFKVRFALLNVKHRSRSKGVVEYQTPVLSGQITVMNNGAWMNDLIASESNPLAKEWFDNVAPWQDAVAALRMTT